MKNKFWIVLAIALVALCLCVGLAACGDPSNPNGPSSGCKHQYTYFQFSDIEHIKQCSKCNFNEHEGHVMRGDTCTLCNYRVVQCEHPQFFYNQHDEEYHTVQCGFCSYNYSEKHTFANGRCTKCQAEQIALVRKIGNLYYTLNADNHTAVVASHDEDFMGGGSLDNLTGSVTIPSAVTYDGTTYTVTSVRDQGFWESNLAEVILPDTITEIGMNAFANCFNLTKVTLSQNLEKIGEWAFNNSQQLSKINLPASVTEIGSDAFHTNSNIIIYCEAAQQPEGFDADWCDTDFHVSNRATVVWNVAETGANDDYDYAVLNDDSVAIVKYKGAAVNLILPATVDSRPVTAIIERACYMSNSVRTVTLPGGLVSIGAEAFYSDNAVYSIDIPATVQNVGENIVNGGVAYFECDENDLSDDIEDYYGGFFAVYNSGAEAVLIDGVRYALNSDNNTAQVSINNYSVQSDVVIPREVTHGGATFTVVGIRDWAFRYTQYGNKNKINSLYIPETVVNFGDEILPNVGITSGAVLYCKGEISEENAWKVYGGLYEANANAVSNAVYDEASNLWYSLVDGKAVVARQHAGVQGGDITVPATITVNGTTYDVTEIREHAFYGRSGIAKVTVGANVTQISAYAFGTCSALKNVEFASGSALQSISNYAFGDCSALQTVRLPASLTTVASDAFHGCGSLKGVYINDLAKWCSVDFYDETSNPLNYAHNLYLNDVLVNVLEIPASVTEISGYAFFGFGGTEVRLHKNVTSIGRHAFRKCSNLQKVTFASDTTDMTIERYAFYDCSSLSAVTVPAGVSSVKEYAFRSCPILLVYCQAASKPSGWDNNWREDDNKISKTVWNCASNNTADDGTVYLEIGGVRYKIVGGEAQVMDQHRYLSGNVTILDEVSNGGIAYPVTTIAANAFENCANVTNITIGANVTSLGNKSFNNCTGLVSVTVVDNSALTEIGSYAFCGCAELTSVTFAEHGALSSIGTHAFEDCSALVSLVIPETVTTINSYAFLNCASLLNVEVLKPQPQENQGEEEQQLGLQTIGEYAFSGCNSLVSLNVPASVTSVGARAFYNAVALTLYCEAAENSESVDGWNSNWQNLGITGRQFAVVWDATNNSVAVDGYEYVYTNGLRFAIKDGTATVAIQPRSVTSATIPATVQYKDEFCSVVGIADYAFADCKQLTSVTFNTDSNFTTVGNYAFQNCVKLENITLPDTVIKVGMGVFNGCTSLPA